MTNAASQSRESELPSADHVVTAIIPSYNHSQYISEAIEGLIAQTYSNVELIVIDDASTDESDRVIRSYTERCKQRFVSFRYIRKRKGGGLAHSLNMAIDEAMGDYLYINGSDDIADPTAIEKLYRFLSCNDDYAVVVGDNRIIDSTGKMCFWDTNFDISYNPEEATYRRCSDRLFGVLPNGEPRITNENFGCYASLLFGNHVPNGYLQRKSAVIEAGKYNETIAVEDWSMQLRLARAHKMKYLDEILFSYRWHSSNTMRRTLTIAWSNYKTIASEKDYALSNGYESEWVASHGDIRYVLRRKLRRWFVTFNIAKRRRQLRLFGVYIVKPPV